MELIKKILAAIKNFFAKLFSKESEKEENEGNEGNDNKDFRDVVCYYGCPNSKNVKKLQTEKR